MKNQIYKDRRKWSRELYQFFADNDICVCEYPGCNSTFGIAGAHRLKRRFINNRDEYMMAAYLCQAHHQEIEFSGHENMFRQITEIIAAR